MPVTLERKNSPEPTPSAGGEGSKKPPIKTAVGLGDSGEPEPDFTVNSAQSFLRRIRAPFNRERRPLAVVAGSNQPKPISTYEMFFQTLPFIAGGYVALELIHKYLR